jgi:hemerythrin superfamily protein
MDQRTKNGNNSTTTSKVVTAAVGGLVVGLMANAGRKVAMQLMDATYGEWDEILKAEHDATLMIFDKLQETGPDQTTKRTMLLHQLKHALTKHALEEENVIYPTMREHGLTEEADELNSDHGYVKQFLFELGKMEPFDQAWGSKVAEFRRQIETHMREEENTLFPQLRQKLSSDANAAMTTALNKEGVIAA